ncbi:uncharacterized protein LOC113280346 [Papaver somniferum]|uniref:uncharacterized protein LOC113280346 n=1 Tax=Papaver somniferum TaxID=3469 RepID=UPI000E705246|nr:uncharacterized protein LOC113280346 [Papaver somniferum]
MSSGEFAHQDPDECFDEFIELAERTLQWASMREPEITRNHTHRVNRVDNGSDILRRLEALEMYQGSKQTMSCNSEPRTYPCTICGDQSHTGPQCPLFYPSETTRDQVSVLHGGAHQGNRSINPLPCFPRNQPQAQKPSPVEQKVSSLEETLRLFIEGSAQNNAETTQNFKLLGQRFDEVQCNQQNSDRSISNIETQISQLSNRLNDRGNEKFPSQSNPNLKGVNQVNGSGSSNHNEHIKAAITLKSGKTLENSVEPPKEKSPAEKENEVDQTSSKDLNGPGSAKSPSGEDIPERQVKINLPLLDAVKHVPALTKFLKEMCTVKRDVNVHKKAFFTQQVSSIISQKYPVKFKDPGCPTVTCVIGSQKIENALLDLGASVNLLPFSVYEQLALVENIFTTNSVSDPLEAWLAHFGTYYDEDSHFKEVNGLLDSAPVMNYGKWQHPDQESRLVSVLQEHKTAIGRTIANLKGISPADCMHHIYLEEGDKTSREMQRRLNPNMKEVVRTEVLKLLDACIIYPISGSKWVSPVQVVPKKSGITVVANENNELIPTRVTTGWRVCIDYLKLNSTTRKYHFPLPFIDQMLERLAGHSHYCFLDGYSGYNQIPIAPEDHEKATFTGPFGTFSYRRMPFGLCNAPATFQRCTLSIFSDRVERFLEIFSWPCWIKDRRFIKDFSKIALPLSIQLAKDNAFVFDEAYVTAFEKLKSLLTCALIIQPPDRNLPFELMCDASDYVVGAVLGQRRDKALSVIYYGSRTLNDAQLNYTTTEKEMLAIVFALEKFRSYLLGSKIFVIRKGLKNVVDDHLSRILDESRDDERPIDDTFPDEQLFSISVLPWFDDIVNYLVTGQMPDHWSKQDKAKFLSGVKYFFWDDLYLFKYFPDQIIRRCIPDNEISSVLTFCSGACGGSL